MINIKSRVRFEISSWFEVFFALQVVTDADSRIHQGWKQQALDRLPAAFHKKFAALGGSSYIWPVLSDTLLDLPLSQPFENRLSHLAQLPEGDLQKTLFYGTFHEKGPVKQLLSGRYDLLQTVTHISKTKREWVAFIGLYPPRKKAPLFQALNMLLLRPAEFRRIAVDLLEIFWEKEFRQTWNLLYPKLERSKEEKERLFQSTSLQEFLRLALLRVELDERNQTLRATRGGYALPVNKLLAAVILPSAFNDKRHWTTYEGQPKAQVAYLPYFDPAISLKKLYPAGQTEPAEPELDPALILKALGDTTRFAMISFLAKSAMTAGDIAGAMSLSRPTVSHHIHLLRDAGLLEEKVKGNMVLLSLKRTVLENLSDLVTRRLFEHQDEIPLKKTRTK